MLLLLLLLLQVTEMPEMEERKNALTLNNARMKKELQEIENTILWVPEHRLAFCMHPPGSRAS